MHLRVSFALFCAAMPVVGVPLYTIHKIPNAFAAYDLSETGYVTGSLLNAHAFLYRDRILQDLGLAFGRNGTVGRAVNSYGHIAGGAANNATENGVAFVYRDGQYHALPTLGGFTEALDINDSGWVVGYSAVPTDPFHLYHTFLYKNGVMQDLGLQGYGHINNHGQLSVQAINEHGSTTGSTDRFGPRLATLTRDGTETILGTLGYSSAGGDLNDRHEVVGSYCPDFREEDCRGFLWRNGIMYDLTSLIATPGFLLSSAEHINNAGQILGRDATGRPVLLEPVPEPSTLFLMVFGTALLLLLDRVPHDL